MSIRNQEALCVPEDQTLGLSYLMLKPDGNRQEVIDYIGRLFVQHYVTQLGQIILSFTRAEALDFYPKDVEWRKKYGEKRLEFLRRIEKIRPEDVTDFATVGERILCEMAEYLSSGPCRMILFETRGSTTFGQLVVGTTVPKDASPFSLRGMFSQDSIEDASRERRALRNVAHAPDEGNVGEDLAFLYGLECMTPEDKQHLAQLARPAFPQLAHRFT